MSDKKYTLDYVVENNVLIYIAESPDYWGDILSIFNRSGKSLYYLFISDNILEVTYDNVQIQWIDERVIIAASRFIKDNLQ